MPLPPCLLPPASCLLPPASCLLPPASCLLPPASCLLPPASCLLPTLLLLLHQHKLTGYIAEDCRRRRTSQTAWSKEDVEKYLGQSAQRLRGRGEEDNAMKVSAEIDTPRAQEQEQESVPPGFQLSKKWVSDLYFRRQVRKVKFHEGQEEEDANESSGRKAVEGESKREAGCIGQEEEADQAQQQHSSIDASSCSESEAAPSSPGSASNQSGEQEGEQEEADDEEEEEEEEEEEILPYGVQRLTEGSSTWEDAMKSGSNALSYSAGTWSKSDDGWQLRTMKERAQPEEEEVLVDYSNFLR
eukprot:766752-Hanusia_phi.AAC.18